MSAHEKYTHWYNSVTLATCCEVARLSLSDTHPEDRQQPTKHLGVLGGVGKKYDQIYSCKDSALLHLR